MALINSSSIKTKLSIRFGVLLAIFIVCVGFTYFTLNKSIVINSEINTVYSPSVKQVQDVKLMMSNSKLLIANWIYIKSGDNNNDKSKLNVLMETEFPLARQKLELLSSKWRDKDKVLLDSIFVEINQLFDDYKKVKTILSSSESYTDPASDYEISLMMQEHGSLTARYNSIVKDLDKLAGIQINNANEASKNMTALLNWFKAIIVLISIGTIVLGFFIIINTINKLVKPINQVKNVLVKMGNGELSDEELTVTEDEIGEMSTALNYLSDRLRQTAAYADKIGNGDLNASYNPLSDKDLLGNSLLEMGKKLKILSEEDKRRNWVTAGLAKFADILRSSSDVVKLSEEIICNLVKYLEANQGGIFLIKEDGSERFLEMTACYAYDRKKFLKKIIYEGEGLLGQCLLERDTIYLTDVPDNYINIASGIGGANPNCIIIQPLILNEIMVGAIEVASFRVFDKFELEFLKKLSENIAVIISNVKINERTVRLLEEARTAQESMRSQEEELRQNLEELTATQEEMHRKEQEYLEKIAALENYSHLN